MLSDNNSLSNFWNNSGSSAGNMNISSNNYAQVVRNSNTMQNSNMMQNSSTIQSSNMMQNASAMQGSNMVQSSSMTQNSAVVQNSSILQGSTYDMSVAEDTLTYEETPHLTMGQWLLTFLIMSIPIANLVMLIIWAVKDLNPTKKTFARATLFWILVMITFTLVMMVVFYDTFNYAPYIDKGFKIFKYAIKKIFKIG